MEKRQSIISLLFYFLKIFQNAGGACCLFFSTHVLHNFQIVFFHKILQNIIGNLTTVCSIVCMREHPWSSYLFLRLKLQNAQVC